MAEEQGQPAPRVLLDYQGRRAPRVRKEMSDHRAFPVPQGRPALPVAAGRQSAAPFLMVQIGANGGLAARCHGTTAIYKGNVLAETRVIMAKS